MKRLGKVVGAGRRLTLLLVAASVAGFALLFRLATLVPSLSPTEVATLSSSASWHTIVGNPTDLPLKVLQWLAHHVPTTHHVLLARLPSVLLAALAIILFTYILRRWYGKRTATFGFVIFVSCAWFLHVGRFAGVEVEYLAAILALLTVHIGLYDHERPLMLYAWLLVNLVLLFVPGFVWFVALSIVWQTPQLVRQWQHITALWKRIVLVDVTLLGLAWPIYSLIRHPHSWTQWLGLPDHLIVWHAYPQNLVRTLLAISFQGPHNPEIWLGQLPILDIFISAMLVAGVAFYLLHWRAARTRLLLCYVALGVVLVSLGGAVRLSVIVPILYIVAIGGIAYLLHFWMRVFPRNPLARGAGIGLVALVIGLSCSYNAWQYFVAWPHNPEVQQIYQHSSPQ